MGTKRDKILFGFSVVCRTVLENEYSAVSEQREKSCIHITLFTLQNVFKQ